jgi:hypothetical protein
MLLHACRSPFEPKLVETEESSRCAVDDDLRATKCRFGPLASLVIKAPNIPR